jgi:hypothetical protein
MTDIRELANLYSTLYGVYEFQPAVFVERAYGDTTFTADWGGSKCFATAEHDGYGEEAAACALLAVRLQDIREAIHQIDYTLMLAEDHHAACKRIVELVRPFFDLGPIEREDGL